MNPVRLVTTSNTDPFHNLMIEYHLLNRINDNDGTVLFLYKNKPSVIIGRFQCPWREINFLNKPDDVVFVRRHSGGGTVYHDLGNWNFCFIKSGTLLTEEENLLFLEKILSRCNVPVTYNERYDLLLEDRGSKKISGSAFRRTKNACFHHGTLLVNAKLDKLKGTLGKHEGLSIEGKGVNSHPSPVTNINHLYPEFNWDMFCHQIETECETSFEDASQFQFSNDDLEYEKKLKSWDWKWGTGPNVNISLNNQNLFFSIVNGVITDVKALRDSDLIIEGARVKCNEERSLGHELFDKSFLSSSR